MKLEGIMKRSFLVNVFLVVLKIFSGIIFNSYALIADGVHSISDLMSDVFVILGIKHSLKPADDEHPFGHGKFEYVLSFILGLSIILIAYNLAKNVIIKFHEITEIPNLISLVVVVAVVIIKLYLAKYLIKKGKDVDSQIISASGKESLTDVFSSIVVFFGIISVILGEGLGYSFLLKGDKIASIIIAGFIVRIGVLIVYDAVKSMQGKSVSKEICVKYKDQIKIIDGVIDVDHIDMIAYGPYYQALVDIRVDGNKTVTEGHDIAEEVTKKLYDSEKICHVVVHVNPEE
ncbi:MAG: cation transporter [Candidatus Izimaplasma sp.]|nr:cation transporter [Candidatus Izimaplasma bacterium]